MSNIKETEYEKFLFDVIKNFDLHRFPHKEGSEGIVYFINDKYITYN